jgi:plastocyanin
MSNIVKLILSVCALASLAIAASTGSLSGKVTGVPAPKALPGAFAAPPAASVVYAVPVKGSAAASTPRTVFVDQQWSAFSPQIIAVSVGDTVEFRNDDTVKHNVHWTAIGGDKSLAHDLGNWPPGKSVRYTFTHPGAIHLQCTLHPEMSAWLIVVPSAYYAVTASNGSFTLKDLPAGEYKLVAWHENLAPKSQVVSVTAKAQSVLFKF